ncbi:MAG: 50S ribosomal protein L15 [Candidatus Omnitrophota bacterium]
MYIHELKSPQGARKRRKIVGRGSGSGHGKTSGRGHKGQKARSGRGILNSLEGGQVPLIRRLAKFGFRSKNPKIHQLVKIESLSRFKEGTIIDANILKSHGLIKSARRTIKVLGDGEIKKSLTVCAHYFSKSAQEKIKQAGGKVEIIKK